MRKVIAAVMLSAAALSMTACNTNAERYPSNPVVVVHQHAPVHVTHVHVTHVHVTHVTVHKH